MLKITTICNACEIELPLKPRPLKKEMKRELYDQPLTFFLQAESVIQRNEMEGITYEETTRLDFCSLDCFQIYIARVMQ